MTRSAIARRDDVVSFVAIGTPAPKGNMRIAPHGRRLYDASEGLPAWTKILESLASEYVLRRHPPLAGPVGFEVVFHLARPKRPKHPTFPIGRPDLDKLLRAVADPFSGAVFGDDGQIVRWLAEARYVVELGEPRAVGRIWALEPQQSSL